MQPEIVRATSRAFLKLSAMLVVGGLAILLLKTYLFPWMHDYLGARVSHDEAVRRFKIFMFGMATPLLVIAIYHARLGFRVLREGRWPLARTLVFRDTPVQRGRSVRARGILFILLAAALAAAAVGIAALPFFYT